MVPDFTNMPSVLAEKVEAGIIVAGLSLQR